MSQKPWNRPVFKFVQINWTWFMFQYFFYEFHIILSTEYQVGERIWNDQDHNVRCFIPHFIPLYPDHLKCHQIWRSPHILNTEGHKSPTSGRGGRGPFLWLNSCPRAYIKARTEGKSQPVWYTFFMSIPEPHNNVKIRMKKMSYYLVSTYWYSHLIYRWLLSYKVEHWKKKETCFPSFLSYSNGARFLIHVLGPLNWFCIWNCHIGFKNHLWGFLFPFKWLSYFK